MISHQGRPSPETAVIQSSIPLPEPPWFELKPDKAEKEKAINGNHIERYQEAARQVCLNLCRCDSTRHH